MSPRTNRPIMTEDRHPRMLAASTPILSPSLQTAITPFCLPTVVSLGWTDMASISATHASRHAHQHSAGNSLTEIDIEALKELVCDLRSAGNSQTEIDIEALKELVRDLRSAGNSQTEIDIEKLKELVCDLRSAGNSQTGIDIEALVKELLRDLRAVDSSSDNGWGHGHPECLISRVNMPTRIVDPSEYDPYSVHIGPYHHDPLHWTEPEKRAVLRRRLPKMEEEKAAKLRHCLTEIAHLEDDARGCYANSTERMGREEFVLMLLLDGCYILHYFGFGVGDHSGASARGSPTSSGIPDGGGMGPSQSRRALDYIPIVRDVVYLLENQIPFFILERIHELFHGESGRGTAVIDAAMADIRWLLRKQGYSTMDFAASPRPCHLVHLLHMHFRPTAPINGARATASSPTELMNLLQHRTGGPAVHRWRLATQYDIAGVKFERRVLDGQLARSVLDVELKGRTLRVPYLTVDNNTWRILRNLMALEQHSPQLGSDVTAYCLFMSQIAGTEKDVALLVKKEIIVHLLGSDMDVAEGFEKLCRGVDIDLKDPRHNYLSEAMQRLERRYHSRWNNWIAWLRRTHLENPWLMIAPWTAIIGFACGVIQAVYTILGAKKSH